MNEKWLPHIIAVGAFVAFVLLGLASASTPAVKFDSANTLKDYLDKQPDNSPDKPIAVSVTVNDQTIKDTLDVINSSGKYVSLILSSNGLTDIPANFFTNCVNLTSLTLPDSVISIKDNAFNGCTNLIEITMGINIANISYTAFNNCPNLISIAVESRGNSNFSSGYRSENGMVFRQLYSRDRTILIRCPEGDKGPFNIPESIKVFAPYSFCQTSITDLSITQDVRAYAFSGSSITYVNLNGGYIDLNKGTLVDQIIYEGAFINCNSLTSVTINGWTSLQKGSFDGDLFDLWDKDSRVILDNGTFIRDGKFKGTYTRPNGTSTTWTRMTRR